jgi:hypothetical protein
VPQVLVFKKAIPKCTTSSIKKEKWMPNSTKIKERQMQNKQYKQGKTAHKELEQNMMVQKILNVLFHCLTESII